MRRCRNPASAAIGGHAVAGVGYDDAKQWFVVRNSWGGKWGMKGYFTLPYAYVTSTIRARRERLRGSAATTSKV
jgi:C1A family cysteine protease